MPAKSGTFFNAVNNFLTIPLSLKAKKKKRNLSSHLPIMINISVLQVIKVKIPAIS